MHEDSDRARFRLSGAALVLVAALAACAEPAATYEECEEGLGGLAHTTDLVPANC